MINVVFKNEFRKRVRSRAFLIITFGGPILLALYVGMILLVTYFSIEAGKEPLKSPIGLFIERELIEKTPALQGLQKTAVYRYTLPDTDDENNFYNAGFGDLKEITIEVFENFESGFKKLQSQDLSVLAVLRKDFLETGTAEQHIFKDRELGFNRDASRALKYFLHGQLYDSLGMQQPLSDRIRAGSISKRILYKETGEKLPDFSNKEGPLFAVAEALQGGSAHIVLWVMLATLALNSHLLFSCLKEERENKVFELLLTSITPEQLITGKVLAIVATGLLQILAWLGIAFIIPFAIIAAANIEVYLDFTAASFMLTVLYTFLGLLFYGYLIAGVGSFVKNTDEWNILNILTGVIIYGAIVFLTIFLKGASPLWWRLLSLFPFFTPILIPIQLVNPTYSTLEATLYLIPLSISLFYTMRISAKLFKLGIKYQNGAPSFKVLLRDFLGTARY